MSQWFRNVNESIVSNGSPFVPRACSFPFRLESHHVPDGLTDGQGPSQPTLLTPGDSWEVSKLWRLFAFNAVRMPFEVC